MATGLAVQAAL